MMFATWFCFFFGLFSFGGILIFAEDARSLNLEDLNPEKHREIQATKDFLKGAAVEPPEEILKWLKSKKILDEPEVIAYKGEEPTPFQMTLNEAIAYTLKNQWRIEIADSEIFKRYGEWQKTGGFFDPILTSSVREQVMIDPQQVGFKTDETGTLTTLSVGVEKLTRTGTVFAFGSSFQTTQNPSLISVTPDFTNFSQSALSVEVRQPLLRNFIYNPESTEELVASLEFEIAQFRSVQVMSEQVLNTVLTYWEAVAAEKIVMINEDAKRILEGLGSATLRLVEKMYLPASELNEQVAELARNRRDLIRAKQDVFAAYNALLLQIGQRRCEFSECIPHLILDNFVLPHEKPCMWDVDCLLNQAYQHRGDLIAARILVREAASRLRLANQNILPALDLILGVQVLNNNVRNRSLFSSLDFRDAEKDYSAELRLSMPFWNDRAKGEKIQRYEEMNQAFLAENELWSSIYSEISTVLRNQFQLIDEIEYANKAAEWYEIALRDEIMRTKAGYGSLFIVIDFEDRFRRTLIERVLIQKEFAQNIARLLFLTGTLVMVDTQCHTIKIDPFNYQHLLVNHE